MISGFLGSGRCLKKEDGFKSWLSLVSCSRVIVMNHCVLEERAANTQGTAWYLKEAGK